MTAKSRDTVEFGFLDDHIGFQINLSRRALVHNRRHERVTPRSSMPSGYYTALIIIGLNPGISPSKLSEALVLDPQASVTILNKLEQLDMANRARSQTDRRRVELTLTDEGQKLMIDLKRRSDEDQAKLSAGLSADETKTLTCLLARVRKEVTARR